MILFVHGFNSSGQCEKCLLLQSKTNQSIIPSLDLLNVSLALEKLENTLKQNRVDIIIGASLGGFYAHYLCKKYDKKLLLINPVLNPLDYIQKVNTEAFDKKEIITKIKMILTFNEKHHFTQDVEVLFGLDDDVVDYKKSRDIFKGISCKFYKDDHRLLSGFKDYLEQNNNLLLKYL